MKPYFYSADEYLKETFGKKIFRLSLDGGTTCPNRDGSKGFGGCVFCSAKGSGDFAEQQRSTVSAQIEAAKQTVNMLIIDKKKMKLKDSGLPAAVLEQTPKYLRGAKFPIVKAKVGPQVMSLIADGAIFDSLWK